eukprot:Amastigsp_a1117_169.p5 type:complete len:118 gc:universal Amastigsp_a1117_169:1010-1363(+)
MFPARFSSLRERSMSVCVSSAISASLRWSRPCSSANRSSEPASTSFITSNLQLATCSAMLARVPRTRHPSDALGHWTASQLAKCAASSCARMIPQALEFGHGSRRNAHVFSCAAWSP